jgi:hypothetical protein
MRWLIVSLFFFILHQSNAQGFGDLILKGADWRMCGTYEEKDTLVFMRYETADPNPTCKNDVCTQLLVYEGLKFRFLTWEKNLCNINLPGLMEINDQTGDILFSFEDGTSRSFRMLFINKQKFVLIDRGY